ncbi:MAG TPA: FemAB family protein, partial [Alphaproteobacteria bacterium]|nr:FemAB family protein [Alphaproteobacteria bacterium]
TSGAGVMNQHPLGEAVKLATGFGLEVIPRKGNSRLWQDLLERTTYVPYPYLPSNLDYELEYHSDKGGHWDDQSFLLRVAGNIVAAWPLTFSESEGKRAITSCGSELLPPLFSASAPDSTKKKAVKRCYDFLEHIARRLDVKEFRSSELFLGAPGLGDWYMEGAHRGAVCDIRHDLYLNTQQPIEDIAKGFRSTSNQSIRQAADLWRYAILPSADANSSSVWKEFEDLHLNVAGRKTRSEKSWRLQRDAIATGTGMLVYLRDDANRMVGGGFFEFSKTEANYSVAAYDRALFGKPVGHLVQWVAIQEFVKRGIEWYRIGGYPLATDKPVPTEKELSIGLFKKGFASHVFPRFILKHSISAVLATAS